MKKPGFSLVTVLFLIVGISITLGGVAFNFVTEAKLQKSNDDSNHSLYAAEVGVESAKMWLQNKLKNSNIPTEIKKIDPNLGAPQYCLKGFNVNEISSIHTDNKTLKDVISLDEPKHSSISYNYYITNISDSYNTSLGYIIDNNIYYMTDDNHVNVINKLTGSPAGSPYSDTTRRGDPASGYRAWHAVPGSDIEIDGDYLYYLTDDNYINVINKITGESARLSNNLFNNTSRRGDPASGFRAEQSVAGSDIEIDGNNLYYVTKQGYISVVDKITGVPVTNFPSITLSGDNLRGFKLPRSPGGGSFTIYGDYIYYLTHDGGVSVVDKLNGNKAPFPYPDFTKYGDQASGYALYEAQYNQDNCCFKNKPGIDLFIDNDNLYYDDQNSFIGVVNKVYGTQADTKLFTTYGRNNKNSGFKAWHDYVGGGSSIKIDGDYLYYITDDNYFNIVHKNNGNTLNNIFPDTTRRGIKSTGFRAWHSVPGSNFIINNSDNKTLDYYQIFSCGIGLNNSIKRILSIFSVDLSGKNIKQISWKEVF